MKMGFKYFCTLTISLFVVSSAYSQTIDNCFNNKLTIEQIIRACKEAITDKNKSEDYISFAAAKIAYLLLLDEKGRSEEIIGYFLVSAQKGRSSSYAAIGDLYRRGYKEIKPDYEKALYYYNLDGGSAIKWKGLGEMYLNGTGVPLRINIAITNFQVAASLDEDDYQIRSKLCEIHSTEKYERMDLVSAYFWCAAAVSAVSDPMLKGVFERDKMKIHSKLTKAELMEVDRLTNECEKKTISSCSIRWRHYKK